MSFRLFACECSEIGDQPNHGGAR